MRLAAERSGELPFETHGVCAGQLTAVLLPERRPPLSARVFEAAVAQRALRRVRCRSGRHRAPFRRAGERTIAPPDLASPLETHGSTASAPGNYPDPTTEP